jgi:DNA-binding beta-propeller fold protein YncE
MRTSTLPLLLAACATLSTAALPAQTDGPYKITHTSLLGGDGGWDYIVPDPSTHRLFIARGTHLMVVDEDSGKLIGEVADIHGAHGTAIAPNYGFASSAQDKSVAMFDLKTLKVISRSPAQDDTDAAIYDAPSNRVFTMNGDAASATVVDASTGKTITNIPLGGKPEYAVSAGDGKIYVDINDKDQIAELDARNATILRRWPTAPCTKPTSLAIDTAHHRLFTGCRSGVLAVSDTTTGKVITTVPIGKGVDASGFDPSTGDIFSSAADGTLTIIHQDTPDQYHVLQILATPIGSRNLGVDPTTHKIFVVAADFGPAPAAGGRKPVLSGTFKLLTIERQP